MFPHYRDFPKTILVVLAKDAPKRFARKVVRLDRSVEKDRAARRLQTECHIVVLIPD
jgi:hypothetical protein